MSHINFDRSASASNKARAQDSFIRAQVAAEYQAKRNAANMRAAVLTGLSVGLVVSIAQLFGVI